MWLWFCLELLFLQLQKSKMTTQFSKSMQVPWRIFFLERPVRSNSVCILLARSRFLTRKQWATYGRDGSWACTMQQPIIRNWDQESKDELLGKKYGVSAKNGAESGNSEHLPLEPFPFFFVRRRRLSVGDPAEESCPFLDAHALSQS